MHFAYINPWLDHTKNKNEFWQKGMQSKTISGLKKCGCCNEYCFNNLCEACEEALAAVTDDEIAENIESGDRTEQSLDGDTEDEFDVDQTSDLPEISTDGSNTEPSNQTPVTGEVILISDSEEDEIIVISDSDESNIEEA